MNPKPIDIHAIVADIKANSAKLEGCAGPHDFSIDATPAKPILKDWLCSKCGGKVDTLKKRWYETGLKHGQQQNQPKD